MYVYSLRRPEVREARKETMIYFDNAATTPVRPEVIDVIESCLRDDWGNPNSLHRKGHQAQKRLDEARAVVASLLGAKPTQIVFTSCATESNNIAIFGTIKPRRDANVVTTPIEHESVHGPMQKMKKDIEVRELRVDRYGYVDLADLERKVDANTQLVSIMHVNNEIGTIQDLVKIGKIVKRINPRAMFHVDGVQGFCKVPLDLNAEKIDYYAMSAHKIGGPKGVGALYARDQKKLEPILIGGGQEFGISPGTQNVAYSCAFAKAATLQKDEMGRVDDLRKALVADIEQIDGAHLISPEDSSPYITSVGIEGIKGEILLHYMEQSEMYLSTGSACSGSAESHVLKAIGVPDSYRDGTIRLSLQTYNTIEEVHAFTKVLKENIDTIRSIIGGR